MTFDTPQGPLHATFDDEQLVRLDFRPGGHENGGPAALVRRLRAELDAYFAGELTKFTVPNRASGTAWQHRVWDALARLPYGTTTSYGALARELGLPSASRAVGAANGRNPIPIIIPCHRVIGANGSLTGFGGGMARKEHLLDLERGALFPAGR